MTDPAVLAERSPLRVVPEGATANSVGFVGRAHEINQLAATYERVRDGQAAAVLLSGDAGMGKTRLVDELVRQAREAGATTATGRCVRTEDGLPYAPIVGLARELVRRVGPAAAEALALLVGGPAIDAGDVPGGEFAHDQPMRHEIARIRLFESILSGFTALAQHAPLVLIVEDLHWADAASVELLDFLTRNLVDASVLLVATYRAGEVDPTTKATLAELGRHPRATTLRLRAMNRVEIAGVVATRLGHVADTRVADAIWERSQGNPFFAEELAAAPDGVVLPDDLRDLLLLKVAELSAEARRVVRCAAAIGDGAEHALLMAAVDLDGEVLDAALEDAIRARLLVVDDVAAGYRFRHALLREAIYSTVLPGERIRLHRSIATALAADPALGDPTSGKRVALLASQWWAAGAWEEAFTFSLAAADAAESALAFRDAFHHIEHAIAALERAPGAAAARGTSRGALLEHAGNLAAMAGRVERVVDIASVALEEYEAAGDVAGSVRALLLRGNYACYTGLGEAVSVADIAEAVRRSERDVPLREHAAALSMLASNNMFNGRFGEAVPLCAKALEVARAAESRQHEAHVLNTLGVSRAMLGHVDEGVALLRESIAIAEELADPQAVNRGYMNLTHALATGGRMHETAAIGFDSAAIGEHMWGVRFTGAAGNSVEALVRIGRYDDALDLIAQLTDEALGTCVYGPVLWPAPIMIRRGDFARAHQLLDEADRLVPPTPLQGRGVYLLSAAELALAEGRIGQAWSLLAQGLDLASDCDERTISAELTAYAIRTFADAVAPGARAELTISSGEAVTRADALLQSARSDLAAPSRDGGQPSPLVAAFVALAEAEHSRLTASDADRWLTAAHALAVPDLPYEVAYCRWREAEALLESRSARPRAVEALTAAAAGAAALGAAPLLACVEQLAQRARIPLAAAPANDGARPGEDLGLTPRELEVLAHLVRGSTDKEIADALFISKKTASVHVSNLLRKLDVANRVEAGKVGQAHGVA